MQREDNKDHGIVELDQISDRIRALTQYVEKRDVEWAQPCKTVTQKSKDSGDIELF
jgi:hypothetical protein